MYTTYCSWYQWQLQQTHTHILINKCMCMYDIDVGQCIPYIPIEKVTTKR